MSPEDACFKSLSQVKLNGYRKNQIKVKQNKYKFLTEKIFNRQLSGEFINLIFFMLSSENTKEIKNEMEQKNGNKT